MQSESSFHIGNTHLFDETAKIIGMFRLTQLKKQCSMEVVLRPRHESLREERGTFTINQR